jgi:serine/threonine protein phosphatase 1
MFEWLKSIVSRPTAYPPAPGGVTLYAIGDIHGRADCLAGVHAIIDRDQAERGHSDRTIEIYLGDYVDRGPDSKVVINRLIERSAKREMVLLKGNHELIMESFLRGETPFEEWRAVGGLETVLSYGVDARSILAAGGAIEPSDLLKRLPVSHAKFIAALKPKWTIDGYCFVHAGLKPGVPLEKQSITDLTWIRDEFLNHSGDFGFVVVHGHTPVAAIEFLPNRVNIDTGAYATNRLSAIRIDSQGLSALSGAPM